MLGLLCFFLMKYKSLDKNELLHAPLRARYVRPRLTVFGEIGRLTQAGSANGSEAGGQGMNMICPDPTSNMSMC